MHPLVIVIPAFKPTFFRQTLESLAAQTDQRFRVYVGNDGGPHDFERICADFPALDLEYRRYDENLGGRSLAGHWNRCIEATEGPWVWLFSDDDIMGPECVAAIHERLAEFDDVPSSSSIPPGDLLRFNTRIIGSAGEVHRDSRPHPAHETGTDFIFDRLRGERDSFVVEYVFRREALERAGGFPDYPVAWCADDVAWFRFSRRGGITTLDRGLVSWRASGVNITDANRSYQSEKLEASGRFLRFVQSDVRSGPDDTRAPREWEQAQEHWFSGQIRYLMPLSPGLCRHAIEVGPASWREARLRARCRLTAWNLVESLRWLRGRLRGLLRG